MKLKQIQSQGQEEVYLDEIPPETRQLVGWGNYKDGSKPVYMTLGVDPVVRIYVDTGWIQKRAIHGFKANQYRQTRTEYIAVCSRTRSGLVCVPDRVYVGHGRDARGWFIEAFAYESWLKNDRNPAVRMAWAEYQASLKDEP